MVFFSGFFKLVNREVFHQRKVSFSLWFMSELVYRDGGAKRRQEREETEDF